MGQKRRLGYKSNELPIKRKKETIIKSNNLSSRKA